MACRYLGVACALAFFVAGCGITAHNPDESGEGEPRADSEMGGSSASGSICATLSVVQPVQPYLTQYIVDRSASMDTPLPDSELTRLEVVTGALLECSRAAGENGLIAFPDEAGCVDLGESSLLGTGPEHFLSHTVGLSSVNSEAAPIEEAIELALDGFFEQDAAVKRVVLFTDGGLGTEPTCDSGAAPASQLAERAREAGVVLSIVGLPGSDNDAAELEDLAELFGCAALTGQSCHYDLSPEDAGIDYESRLCELADPPPFTIDYTCSFQLNVTGSADYSAGQVTVQTLDPRTGERATLELEPTDYVVDANNGTFELVPEACDLIRIIIEIQATFPCV